MWDCTIDRFDAVGVDDVDLRSVRNQLIAVIKANGYVRIVPLDDLGPVTIIRPTHHAG